MDMYERKSQKTYARGWQVCAFVARLRQGWNTLQRELKTGIYPFLGFASQSDWSLGYTQLLLFALTSFSTLFLQLSSNSTQHIMVLQSACCLAALAKQSPETLCKRCFHWGITGLYLMTLIMHKSLFMFYMTYFQRDLSSVWASTFISDKHSI